ncbi:hypothetical protein ATANTOWER_018796 [Ataeniobius toweri]|uniref:Uncharacterized protein n=1 Tax=Ataeniobius toweri TaxID=208326 RepID=A0ABU7AZR3_9TELE|nr:hypothetical protein [Ataeniobius toweri]
MQKTLPVEDSLSRMTAGLPDAIVQAIQTRFAGVLDDKDALLAAVSCTKFKLRWLKDTVTFFQSNYAITDEAVADLEAAFTLDEIKHFSQVLCHDA